MIDEQQAPVEASVNYKEIAAVHAAAAVLLTFFFRWQKLRNNFWEAGDESLVANVVGGLIDMAYWFFKPKLLKWRNS